MIPPVSFLTTEKDRGTEATRADERLREQDDGLPVAPQNYFYPLFSVSLSFSVVNSLSSLYPFGSIQLPRSKAEARRPQRRTKGLENKTTDSLSHHSFVEINKQTYRGFKKTHIRQ